MQNPNDIQVTEAWSNFIQYCRTKMPYGDIKVRIVNGEPTERLEEKSRVRFDRPYTIPIV